METGTQRKLDFTHPWKIKGENKAITIIEDLAHEGAQDLMISEFVQQHLFQLKNAGCFDRGCTRSFLSAVICYHRKSLEATLFKEP